MLTRISLYLVVSLFFLISFSKESKANKTNTYSHNLIFDLPVSYNRRVSYWIEYFQTKGRTWFKERLSRSSKYLSYIQQELHRENLPLDLAYMVMIESGFSLHATSTAQAVGPWQFIPSTARRYGLTVNSWLDERKDLRKSTLGAIRYMRDLHEEFHSWYLVVAAYNMGENGLRKKIQRYGTRDYWDLCRMGALPEETIDYVPKILAAMMISKVPGLYGFENIAQMKPYEYDVVVLPGGTQLKDLAYKMGFDLQHLKELNAEMLQGKIPSEISRHTVRVPRGSSRLIANFLETIQNRTSEKK